jgi:hypothetical protein
VKPLSRAAGAAVVACGVLVSGRSAPAATTPVVCSSSVLNLNASPIADGTDGRCATPPGIASSEKSTGWVDSSGPGSGNMSASGGIRTGTFSGGAHVSINDEGVLETLFWSQSIGQLFEALTVHAPGLDGTAGTVEVPVHVTGGFSGTSANVPATSTALPPTISGGFSFFCGGVVGGCGSQQLSYVDGGPASQPFDQTFTMTIPFVFGQQVFFDVTFKLTAGLRGAHLGDVETRMSGIVDAGEMGTFGKATVRDAQQQPVAGATIASLSGFDYVNAVPEPEPSMRAVAALACLGLLCRRRGSSRTRAAEAGYAIVNQHDAFDYEARPTRGTKRPTDRA